jgi:oxygen-independent coproporphyrinogen-3 oxidase
MKYWMDEEYLGFGAAAHSYIGGKRFNYIADMDKYCENVLAGQEHRRPQRGDHEL